MRIFVKRCSALSLFVLILVGMVGCASFPDPIDTKRRFEFRAPMDTVWEAVIHYFASNQIPIKTLEKASGIVYAERTVRLARKDDEYAECPKGGMYLAETNSRSTQMNVFVAEEETDQVSVTVNIAYQRAYSKKNMMGRVVSSDLYDCESTGKAEEEIYELIKEYIDEKSND